MTPEELKAIEERAEKAKFSVTNGEDFRSFIVALSPILDDDFPALCAALREAWARAEKAEATLIGLDKDNCLTTEIALARTSACEEAEAKLAAIREAVAGYDWTRRDADSYHSAQRMRDTLKNILKLLE